jgi:hypothetical protein
LFAKRSPSPWDDVYNVTWAIQAFDSAIHWPIGGARPK